MNDITSWLFAIGLMGGAVSLIAFISVGLAPLFRRDVPTERPRPHRHR